MLQVLPVHNLLQLLGSKPQKPQTQQSKPQPQKQQQNPFMGFLHRVENVVNNDVVKPVKRAVNPAPQQPLPLLPIDRTAPGYGTGNFNEAMQGHTTRYSAPNPGIATPLMANNSKPALAIDPRATPLPDSVFAPANPQTQQLVNKADSIYSFTPEFRDIIRGGQPNAAALGNNANLKKGVQAAAEFQAGYSGTQGNQRHLTLGPGYGSEEPAVTHEALHAAYFDKPGVPQQFDKVASKNLTPDVKQYLDYRLTGYKQYTGKKSLDNYNELPMGIKSEIHSYLSEFPMVTNKNLPAGLQKYYSRFINVNGAIPNYINRADARQGAQDLLDPKRITARYNYKATHPNEDY